MTSTRVIQVDPNAPMSAARAAARALRAGKLVGFATETVYGVGAVATNAEAVQRLRSLKDRPDRPFTVHVSGVDEVRHYVSDVPPAARRLMGRAWPGPVTLLLPSAGELPDKKLRSARLSKLLCPGGVVGLRCPDEATTLAMLAAVKAPVIATSGNRAGRPSPRSAEQVLASLDGLVDLLVDSGPARLGKDSTVVRFDGGDWRVLRKGPHDERAIRKFMHRKVLFVCTGNTCRSPMAAGLAKALLAGRESCRVGQLRSHGLEVLSAGLFAGSGASATAEAVRAVGALGADIGRHRSRKLTVELINSSDLVVCMTEAHVEGVSRLAPSAGWKVRRLLGDQDIPDPIGGGPEVYRRTAERIQGALEHCMREVT